MALAKSFLHIQFASKACFPAAFAALKNNEVTANGHLAGLLGVGEGNGALP